MLVNHEYNGYILANWCDFVLTIMVLTNQTNPDTKSNQRKTLPH